jgi:hypothetical protein
VKDNLSNPEKPSAGKKNKYMLASGHTMSKQIKEAVGQYFRPQSDAVN